MCVCVCVRIGGGGAHLEIRNRIHLIWDNAQGYLRALGPFVLNGNSQLDITADYDGPTSVNQPLQAIMFQFQCELSGVDGHAALHPIEPFVGPRCVRVSAWSWSCCIHFLMRTRGFAGDA